MSVYYKFRSVVKHERITFDGQHISVKDLKKAIMLQKRIGENGDVDLQVMDAQTKLVYMDENFLIPKNSSLLIARVPVSPQKTKQWESREGEFIGLPKVDEDGPIEKSANLFRSINRMDSVPPNYRCHKCHQGGHWMKDCYFTDGKGAQKSTGISRNFMVNVEGPQLPRSKMIMVDYETPENFIKNNKSYFENLVYHVGDRSENIDFHSVRGLTSSPPDAEASNDESKKSSFSEESDSIDPSTSKNLDSIMSSPGDISVTPTLDEPTAMSNSVIQLCFDFSRLSLTTVQKPPHGRSPSSRKNPFPPNGDHHARSGSSFENSKHSRMGVGDLSNQLDRNMGRGMPSRKRKMHFWSPPRKERRRRYL
ncbi:uncharacterized protein [Leptinotarsa decemlineata]|uniref:uncharacterized protein n=1 Tax=Leptinotarsa decemlineata TaxID=7539 RepID=UPI003D309A0E